jgi:flagellar biosynthesis/type III secretory pathway protein FliH
LLPLAEITDEKQQIELTKELLDFVDKALKSHNRRLDEAMIHKALKPIYGEKEKTMIKSIFDEKYDEGVALGKARGEAEGKAEAGRNMVLAVLRAKFKRVPKNIERSIFALNDPVALESWAVQAATCQSLDEFAEALM